MLQELYVQHEINSADFKSQKQRGMRFLGALHAKLVKIPAEQHTSRAAVQKLIHEQDVLQGLRTSVCTFLSHPRLRHAMLSRKAILQC